MTRTPTGTAYARTKPPFPSMINPYPIKMKLRSTRMIKSPEYRKPPEIKRHKTQALINAKGKLIGYVDLNSGDLFDKAGNFSQATTISVLGRIRENKAHKERRELAIQFLTQTAATGE